MHQKHTGTERWGAVSCSASGLVCVDVEPITHPPRPADLRMGKHSASTHSSDALMEAKPVTSRQRP